MMRHLIATLATSLFASLAAAQDAATTQAIVDAWQDWAEDRGIDGTAIAIGYNGRALHLGGIGRHPQEPYALASLSKAITAVCLHDVLKERGISTAATLGDLARHFDKAGVAIPPAASDISLSNVMTMSSGLYPDTTQGTFLFNRFKEAPNNRKFAQAALMDRSMRGTRGTYRYNNSNYAVLGALLDGLTRTDNVTACRDRVFPAGNRGTVGYNAEWIAFSAFGGWEASVADYLGFVMRNFGPDSRLARNPYDAPHQLIEEPVHYGLGALFFHREGRSTFWHTGAFCNFGFADQGSYFVQYANGYAVVVSYDVCGRAGVWRPLDAALSKAAQGQ